jgi:hypothetical protein
MYKALDVDDCSSEDTENASLSLSAASFIRWLSLFLMNDRRY